MEDPQNSLAAVDNALHYLCSVLRGLFYIEGLTIQLTFWRT